MTAKRKIRPSFEFSDERGLLIEIYRGKKWKQMNYLFCKNGFIRGGHYHKKTNELFFVADGLCEVTIINVKTHRKRKFTANYKDIFFVRPYEVHYIRALKDSKLIAVLDIAHDKNKPDMFLYERKNS